MSEMSAQRYYFFCIYTNRSLKESFLQKNTKVHPKWLLIKKTLFERKGLQNPPIDKKKLPKQKKNKGKYKNKCQNIWWNKIKAVPLQSLLKSKGGYQSGQMGQTVNLLAMPSVVRIHHHPLFPNITRDKRVRISYEIWIFLFIRHLYQTNIKQTAPVHKRYGGYRFTSNCHDTICRVSPHRLRSPPCGSNPGSAASLHQ